VAFNTTYLRVRLAEALLCAETARWALKSPDLPDAVLEFAADWVADARMALAEVEDALRRRLNARDPAEPLPEP
jgi:hypothetical protein